MVFGTFDLLHPGHLFVLEEAKKRGPVTVVVARDVSVEKMKKFRAVQSESVRQKAIQVAFPEMDVRLGDTKDFLVPIRETLPTLILLGYDQRLPHGITEEDFPCPIERLPAFHPEIHKSSLKRHM